MPIKVHALDVLQLRVEWQETLHGEARRHLAANIHINGAHFQTYASDPGELTRSVLGPGEFFINTCTCGSPGCVNIRNGVVVRHEPGTVLWYAPVDFGGSGDTGSCLRYRVYKFDYDAYRMEVIECLKSLIRAKRRKADVLVTFGLGVWDIKRWVDELLGSPSQNASVEGSPQDRLADAIEKGDIRAAQCALVDGADLLQGNDAECQWQRAVALNGGIGYGRRSFVTILAQYLPTPIPGEANPDWLLNELIEDGPAELLYQMTVPGGALPLNDERARRCRERLESLRAMWQSKPAGRKSDERDSWESSLDRRRELLDIELKLEALDRSTKVLEEHRVASEIRSSFPNVLSM